MKEENVKSAVKAIYDYNFKTTLRGHCNLQRTYALNEDSGLLICTWPKGNRPEIPFVYSDEVWTGIEYQVATHLIQEGYLEEGLTVVEAVRNRHDGIKRNPWNEVECGYHYARSLASFGVWVALSGYHCDLPAAKLTFHPVITGDALSIFFICGRAWGTVKIEKDKATGYKTIHTEVLYGDLEGIRITVE